MGSRPAAHTGHGLRRRRRGGGGLGRRRAAPAPGTRTGPLRVAAGEGYRRWRSRRAARPPQTQRADVRRGGQRARSAIPSPVCSRPARMRIGRPLCTPARSRRRCSSTARSAVHGLNVDRRGKATADLSERGCGWADPARAAFLHLDRDHAHHAEVSRWLTSATATTATTPTGCGSCCPGVYRARDTRRSGRHGPLRELSARIGAQMAVVRRSIDRLWDDQSIETCDDWVIPYIGDLLATNLVAGLDARGQRLDVAKTIHYRRRKGTLAVLEEIARDVTGWEARVVGVLPPPGPNPPRPRSAGRRRSRGDALRSPARACTAPDRSCCATPVSARRARCRRSCDLRLPTGPGWRVAVRRVLPPADFRRGEGAVGRYGIPKLLVFLWRLQSFRVEGGTPVAVSGCPDEFVFDPTGRTIPMFLAPLAPEEDDWSDTWTSAPEWQVPGPLTSSLAQAIADPGTVPPRHAPYPGAGTSPRSSPQEPARPPEPAEIQVLAGERAVRLPGRHDSVGGGLLPVRVFGDDRSGPYDRTLLGDPPSAVDARAAGRCRRLRPGPRAGHGRRKRHRDGRGLPHLRNGDRRRHDGRAARVAADSGRRCAARRWSACHRRPPTSRRPCWTFTGGGVGLTS